MIRIGHEIEAARSVLRSTFLLYSRAVKRHPWIACLIGLLGVSLVAFSARQGRLCTVVMHLAGIVLGVFVIDVISMRQSTPPTPLPVHHPGIELLVALGSAILAAVQLHYAYAPPHVALPWRLLFVVGFFFSFPIAIALFLWMRGYRANAMGIRWQGFACVPVVMVLCAVLIAFCVPLVSIWKEVYSEFGSVWKLAYYGVLVAALPEEFYRMVWQTRFGAYFHNQAAGWLFASVLWALLHTPVLYSQAHSLISTITPIVEIIPIGLLWGYLTFRTQSILPSTLLHATKVFWAGV